VLAVDGHGRPALVGRRHGEGCAVLCTYPLEYMAARSARVNPEDTWRLYDALAAHAGVERPVVVADPEVFAAAFAHDDGRRFAVFASQHDHATRVTPVVASGALHTLDGTPTPDVDLAAYGTAVREIR
jgi:beta-glucosidase